MKRNILLLLLLTPLIALHAQKDKTGLAQKISIRENIVYGMVSGTALLMDVYQPANSNRTGIIVIPGSAYGYAYPESYDEEPLKNDYHLDTGYLGKWAQWLVNKGYTIFVISHRFAPRFKYPDILADCRRAVRFIRSNAKEYGIRPGQIGAFGHSSGASLAGMLGVTDTIIENAISRVDSSSSKVQAVVALAAPFNLADVNRREDTTMQNAVMLRIVLSVMGELPITKKGEFVMTGKFADASPMAHVTGDDAPFLIYYSDNDPLIPPRQAPAMYSMLQKNNVPAKIFALHDAGHNPLPDMDEVDKWYKQWLKSN